MKNTYIPLGTYMRLEAVKELQTVNEKIDKRIKRRKPYKDLQREHRELVNMVYGTTQRA